MDNSNIYKNIILDACFRKIKNLRISFDECDDYVYGISTIIDVGGSDYRKYAQIMKSCNLIILRMIPFLIQELFDAYKIQVEWHVFERKNARIYYYDSDTTWDEYELMESTSDAYVFTTDHISNKRILFIFKEYGINNSFPH